jgi:hypothetical protein
MGFAFPAPAPVRCAQQRGGEKVCSEGYVTQDSLWSLWLAEEQSRKVRQDNAQQSLYLDDLESEFRWDISGLALYQSASLGFVPEAIPPSDDAPSRGVVRRSAPRDMSRRIACGVSGSLYLDDLESEFRWDISGLALYQSASLGFVPESLATCGVSGSLKSNRGRFARDSGTNPNDAD